MADQTEPVLRPFADVIRDIGGGTIADDAAVQLAEVVRAVQATGRKGSLTIRIDVARVKGLAEMFSASAKIVARLPEGDPVAGMFWATDDGALVRDNPRQAALFARPQVVPEPDARISDAR